MTKDILNVVLASDDNYAQPLGVAIYSMLDNFSSEKYSVKITILDGGIREENKQKLLSIVENFDAKINFIKMRDEFFNGFPIIQHYSVAIYYRLLIPSLFGKEIKKVLYLDCDILVLGNIAELYNMHIEEHYLAGVKDFISDQHLANPHTLFYGKIKKMFNSGVLLLNLEKIKGDDFVNKTLSSIKENSEKLTWPDQEALNVVSVDKWLEVDNGWNYQIDTSQLEIIPRPKILHYTNSYKPWHAFYNNYYQKQYKKYLKKAWPNYTLKPVSTSVIIKQLLKHIPFSVALVRWIKRMVKKII